MKSIRTIILAAGKGTRMKSEIPKVLHCVCGKPIIQYVLDVAKSIGSLKTYVVLGYKGHIVADSVTDDIIAVEQAKLLGTADAVKTAERFLRSYTGDVLILCGDTPLLNKSTVKKIVQKHKKSNAICTFLTSVVHNPKGYGRIIRDEQENVVAIREDKDAVGLERNIAEINVGVYCCRSKELFKALRAIKINQKKKEFYLTDVIEYFFENKQKIETIEAEDSTESLGINTREDLAVAARIMRERILKKLMLEGVTIVDPQTTYVNADAKIGMDTVINPYTYIESDVRVGKNCCIGPFARLRSGARIADMVEIGNFTEISRTKIGKKTFMKHFSFLGDSVIGSHVNIGAGVITANFDGREKNVTRIDNGSFIGSDAVLIAPVKVGKNAVVGAGSVVTKGKVIPDNSLAVGVPAKIISKGKRK